MTPAQEIVRAFDAVAEEVIGRKHKRKLIKEMHHWLLCQIPDNGVGPVLGARREAVLLLDSAVQSCEKRAP